MGGAPAQRSAAVGGVGGGRAVPDAGVGAAAWAGFPPRIARCDVRLARPDRIRIRVEGGWIERVMEGDGL